MVPMTTCVKALAFQAPNKGPFEAQYKRPSVLFKILLNKLLLGKKLPTLQIRCYKVSWGGKMTATQSSTIALSVKRLKGYSFTLFHHVFWKRTIFEGVPTLVSLVSLVPKVPWGLKNMWKKLQKFPKKFDDFPRNFVILLFQIYFLQPDCFQIPPLDGGPQQLNYVKHWWFQVGQRFLKFFNWNTNFFVNLDMYKIQYKH